MRSSPRSHLVYATGLAFALFQLIVPAWAGLFDMQLRALHVLLTTAAILLAVPGFRAPRLLWALLVADAVMVALAAAATLPSDRRTSSVTSRFRSGRNTASLRKLCENMASDAMMT